MAHQHCATGKSRYDAPKEAHDAAQRIRTRHGFDATAYHCTACGGWHITGHTRLNKIKTRARTGKPTQPYKRERSSWMRGGEE